MPSDPATPRPRNPATAVRDPATSRQWSLPKRIIIAMSLLGVALCIVPVVEVYRWPKAPAAWFAVKQGMELNVLAKSLPPPASLGMVGGVGSFTWLDGPWTLTITVDSANRVRTATAVYGGRHLLADPRVFIIK